MRLTRRVRTGSPRSTGILVSSAIVALLAIAGCRHGEPPPAGDILASLTVPSADEQPFDASSLRGKPTLVMFASPTCGYCAQELPMAHKIVAAENANMVVVYIAGGKGQAIKAAKRGGYRGPVLVDDGTLRKRYEIQGVPYVLMLKPDGTAHEAFRGLQEESTLRDAIADAR